MRPANTLGTLGLRWPGWSPGIRRQRAAVGGRLHRDVHRLHLPGRSAGAGGQRAAGTRGLVVDGLRRRWLGWELAWWPLGGPLATTAAFSVVLAVGMLATLALAAQHVGLAIALGVWGIANTALYPICQIRVMKAAPQAQALAGTINVSAANGGIALGAVIGGASIAAWEATAWPWSARRLL